VLQPLTSNEAALKWSTWRTRGELGEPLVISHGTQTALPLFAQRFSLLWLTASQSPVSDSLGIPTISSVARPVNTKAFTAIYPRKCYATTNFLDPDLDFLGLRQKVTCPITAAFTRR